jgi:hypothetical protein
MFEIGEPYASGELMASLGAVGAEGSSYLAAIPAPEFFEPQGAAWSPAEHVRHLAKSARPVARAMGLPRIALALRFGIHRGSSPSFADLRARYLAQLAAGGTAGRFTPDPQPRPDDPETARNAIIARWLEAHGALRAVLAAWDERALDRYRLPHPLLGPLTMREMMAFTAYHTAHHLRRVAERRGAIPDRGGSGA